VVGRDDQPEAGDGQIGRYGVAERPVLLKKPGNAGGGKGPWFKAGTESGQAREIGATLGNSGNVRELRQVPHAEAKEELGFIIREANVRQVVALAIVRRMPGCCAPGNTALNCGSGDLRMTFRVQRYESCPKAGCRRSACPV
jgi:hypothetical protein